MKPFKNAVIYRLTRDAIDLEAMQEQLESSAFKPCGSQDRISTGYRQYQWNEFFKQFIPFVHRVVYMPLLCQLESNRFIWADNGGITSPFLLPAKYIKNWDYVDEN